MDQDLSAARRILEQGSYTCVLCKGDLLLTDKRRGIRPLMELLASGRDLRGFCAADKVVGKAAAFLYRLLGVKAVYAGVISQPAIRVLTDGGIEVWQDQQVPAIRNRDGSGYCPMETAVWDTEDPNEALAAITAALRAL